MPPTTEDIILVEDEQEPQYLWKLAKVHYLIFWRDGHICGAVLHVPSSGRNVTLQHPLQWLYTFKLVHSWNTGGEPELIIL